MWRVERTTGTGTGTLGQGQGRGLCLNARLGLYPATHREAWVSQGRSSFQEATLHGGGTGFGEKQESGRQDGQHLRELRQGTMT